MICRHCSATVTQVFLDLGFAPFSNAYLNPEDLQRPEQYYPLKVMVCNQCWLVQTEDYASADALFPPDYAYFSSTSKSWLEHAELYVKEIITTLALNEDSFVVEVACNDGYLLKNFVTVNIPCVGIEPTAATAVVAENQGISVVREFFGQSLGRRLASEGRQADLIIGNNVYAHVPDINDFTRGLKFLLKSNGTITLEFPHVMRLIQNNQFDTVYHEHYSYLSLYTAMRVFSSAGLRVWNVEQLPTHGGSLRIYGCHENDVRKSMKAVTEVLKEERDWGLQTRHVYGGFQAAANWVKDELVRFLIEQKHAGKTVVAYGAAAKGNTLLNYAGIKSDLIAFVCDAAESKQGRYLPGSHIPIVAPTALSKGKVDYLLVLPWNIAAEVKEQNEKLVASGTRFVTAVPRLDMF